MGKTAAVVGAGIIGRIVAHELLNRDWSVTLFEKDDENCSRSCTYAGAGMLAPSCELETADEEISALGAKCLDRWQEILKQLNLPVFFQRAGSLVVAHGGDHTELERLKARILTRAPDPSILETVDTDRIREIEPELADKFTIGLYFADEGQIDNRDLLTSLGATLDARGARFNFRTKAGAIEPRRVNLGGTWTAFDWIIDARGMGAKEDLKDLRGVRGEIIRVHAPDVHLSRPVRLMHPRYPIYIVPRPQSVYVVGATVIEADDDSQISIRSTLELLSAAYSLHPGFAEGRVIETLANRRPAFPDNLPRVYCRQGLIRINGLFRHGFLLAPAMAEFATHYINTGCVVEGMERIIRIEQ